MKIMIDVTPMLATKTGVGYYTERLLVNLAHVVPEDVELVGFYYNFLGRRDASHLPKAKNIRYAKLSLIPSKIVYQLRRWGIEFPLELFTLEKADFVIYPNFLDHPSLFRTPSAPVIHDLTFADLPQYVAPKLRGDLTRFVPRAINRSAFIITVSEFSREGISKKYGIPINKILVTHIPAQPVKQLGRARRKALLKKIGINKPFLLFVGTIDPRKNILGLIDIYRNLPKPLRDRYSLVLAGRIELLSKDREAKDLERAAQEGHDIIHLGYVSDKEKNALYQSADLFISASEYEGFGMPVLEAMSLGVPCALSNIPPFVEIGGKSSTYFDPTDPKKAAAIISPLLENPRLAKTYGEKSRQHAATYRWEAIAKAVFSRIRESLDSSSDNTK